MIENILKTAYYEGEPIVSDDEYDASPESIVGYSSEASQSMHPNRMLSLGKVQVRGDLTERHYQACISLLSRHSKLDEGDNYILEYKLDGLAVNLVYDSEYRLASAITRGNGIVGQDVTDKLKTVIERCRLTDVFDAYRQPTFIEKHFEITNLQLRCEIVMRISVFNEKYSQDYSHPRNLVAGIVNSKTVDERFDDIEIIPLEFVYTNDGKTYAKPYLRSAELIRTYADFKAMYDRLLDYRSTIDRPTDGLVLRSVDIEEIEANDHEPYHAIAIKFPPKGTIAKIKKIEWRLTKTGIRTPVAILEPTVIDGRTIKRVHCYNWRFVESHELGEGASVEIVISGDIIPQIIRVVEPAPEPEELPYDCVVEGVHAKPIDAESALKVIKFVNDCQSLGFKNIGPSTWKSIGTVVNYDWIELFSPQLTVDVLRTYFGPKTARLLREYLDSKKSIRLRSLILRQGINGLGGTTAKQIARKLSGLSYDYKGLEKSIVTEFDSMLMLMKIAADKHRLMTYDIEIVNETDAAAQEHPVRYVLTGSPKSHGFATKNMFVMTLPSNWQEVSNIADADYLITDDLSSSSSKMSKARQLNKTIVTYTDIKTITHDIQE